MNFFGHAVVALEESDEPAFVLGAMLPDLVSMAGLRLSAQHDAQLARGVALHHETDRRFHAAPAFRALCVWAVDELEAQGVSRGTARAVGHVGSELLLDGVLSHDEHARAHYLRALVSAIEGDIARRACFAEVQHPERLHRLLCDLSRAPLPDGYREVDFVYQRIQRILARRPRLALAVGDAAPVEQWLTNAAPRIREQASGLLLAAR